MLRGSDQEFYPLMAERWEDLEKLFGPRGIAALLVQVMDRWGVEILEGGPTDFKTGLMPIPFLHTGLAQAFVKVGFTEAMRRSRTRPIMRKIVMPRASKRGHTRSS